MSLSVELRCLHAQLPRNAMRTCTHGWQAVEMCQSAPCRSACPQKDLSISVESLLTSRFINIVKANRSLVQ
eukprot:24352-Eustigmatos_ZCMA.PRE.1